MRVFNFVFNPAIDIIPDSWFDFDFDCVIMSAYSLVSVYVIDFVCVRLSKTCPFPFFISIDQSFSLISRFDIISCSCSVFVFCVCVYMPLLFLCVEFDSISEIVFVSELRIVSILEATSNYVTSFECVPHV